MDYKHTCDTIFTHFQGITNNIYGFGRILKNVASIFYPSSTRLPYYYPSIFVFTRPNDGWMGLYIKLCVHGKVWVKRSLHSFKATGISSTLGGSEAHLLSNNLAAGLNAADRQQHARDEVTDLLLDSEDDDTEDDFSGFSDVSESNDDDQ